MTIYLFIDLSFNEIGCYPTSLRDEMVVVRVGVWGVRERGKKPGETVKQCCY